MWSVGCICAELFIGIPIFPGTSKWDQLRRILKIMGPLPQSMMNSDNMKKRSTYFVYDEGTQAWRLKTREEYMRTTGEMVPEPADFYIDIKSLDDLELIF
jgi:dual specificity protein kinase YAK1